MAECRGLAPLARRHALVSTEARFARPVDIPNWSAWGDLHSQGCSGLSRTGLLFAINLSYGSKQNGLVDCWIYGGCAEQFRTLGSIIHLSSNPSNPFRSWWVASDSHRVLAG